MSLWKSAALAQVVLLPSLEYRYILYSEFILGLHSISERVQPEP